jgi:hypothetical protein
MRDADEKRVVAYTREAEQQVVRALDDMHSVVKPTEAEGELMDRTYVVIRFSETTNGLAASLGMFGDEDTVFGMETDIRKAAVGTAKTPLSTIASHICGQELTEKLAEVVELAINVRRGAESFCELSEEDQERAEKETREEMMEAAFKALKAEGRA